MKPVRQLFSLNILNCPVIHLCQSNLIVFKRVVSKRYYLPCDWLAKTKMISMMLYKLNVYWYMCFAKQQFRCVMALQIEKRKNDTAVSESRKYCWGRHKKDGVGIIKWSRSPHSDTCCSLNLLVNDVCHSLPSRQTSFLFTIRFCGSPVATECVFIYFLRELNSSLFSKDG